MGRPGALLLLVCVRTMRPNIIDALALTCLIGAGACIIIVVIGIVGGIVSALFEGCSIFGHPKRRKP